jgi:hypothetical protein
VLVGGTIGHELAGWGTPNPSGGDRVRGAVALGLLFGSVTGGVAGLVGAAVGADEWRRVPLGARVGLAPAQAGAGLAVRVPFGGGAGAGALR